MIKIFNLICRCINMDGSLLGYLIKDTYNRTEIVSEEELDHLLKCGRNLMYYHGEQGDRQLGLLVPNISEVYNMDITNRILNHKVESLEPISPELQEAKVKQVESIYLKSQALGINTFNYIIDKYGYIKLTEVTDKASTGKFTIHPCFDFIKPYAFEYCQFSEVSIRNNPYRTLRLSGLFQGIRSKHIKLYVEHPEKIIGGERMFTNSPNLEKVDFGNLTQVKFSSLFAMFRGCQSLLEADFTGIDTSWVSDFSGLFDGCINLKKLNISTLDTSRATDISYMFAGCKQLTDLDLHHFDTTKVDSYAAMFQACTGLKRLDLSSFDTRHIKGCINVTDMFLNAKKLEEILIPNMRLHLGCRMDGMFNGCSYLNKVDTSDPLVLYQYNYRGL